MSSQFAQWPLGPKTRKVITCNTGPQAPLLSVELPMETEKKFRKKIHRQTLALQLELQEAFKCINTLINELGHLKTQITILETREQRNIPSLEKAIETLSDQVNLIFVAQGANPPNLPKEKEIN